MAWYGVTFIYFYLHHENVGFAECHRVLFSLDISYDLFGRVCLEYFAAKLKLEQNIPSPFIAFNLSSIHNYTKA